MGAQLPNFVVVGAPKCGTTSLYHCLKQHPDVFLPEQKELHYFSYEYMRQYVAGPGDAHILTTLCKNEAEYAAYYKSASAELAVGDISPSYFYYSDVPDSDLCDRMRALLGKPRIIVMMRDPVQKAFSQYMHLVRDRRETLSFREALAAEQERTARGYSAMWRYAESSLFTRRIRRFFEAFGRSSVKTVEFTDFTRRPQQTLRSIFDFLGVDPNVSVRVDSAYNRSGVPRSGIVAQFIARPNPVTTLARRLLPLTVTSKVRDVLQRANTGAKPEIDAESHRRLEQYFAADRAELESLLGEPRAVAGLS